VLTRLDSAGRLVSCTGDVLADLGGGGLLGVGGDCKMCQCFGCGGWQSCRCSLFSDACSPRPLRRLSDMLMVGGLVVKG
jgi:hypothetical protein